ncbi:MAG: rhodanese-like domain-containing protein [Crocinitomicaceae bacterium]|nr:rhodanese-like domain-containing protein [Crocinitomicaceae bacterium]
MGILSNVLGLGGGSAAKELIGKGAVIIDVRTPGEFQGGHVAGSKNIPLQEIQKREKEIMKLNKPVVFCCASGGRSGQATRYFKNKGLECANGGGWTQVNGLV